MIMNTGSEYDGKTGTLVEESLDDQIFSHKGSLSIGKRFTIQLHDDDNCQLHFDGLNLKRNDIVYKAGLLKVEVIAGRLYTGPM